MGCTVAPCQSLACHGPPPASWRGGVAAEVALNAQGELCFRFRLTADLARVLLPPFALPRRGERLWEHTCFEAFVGAAGDSSYLELNFAPSGEWAAYRFKGYRDGMIAAPDVEPQVAVRRAAGRLELDARLALAGAAAGAAAFPAGACLRLALAAVIEDASGGLSYWALRHAPGRPDFHHPDAFVLTLGVVPGVPGDDAAAGPR